MELTIIGLSTLLFTQLGPPDVFNAIFQSVQPVTQLLRSCQEQIELTLSIIKIVIVDSTKPNKRQKILIYVALKTKNLLSTNLKILCNWF